MQSNFQIAAKSIVIASAANLAFWVPLAWATQRSVLVSVAFCLLGTVGGLMVAIWREATATQN